MDKHIAQEGFYLFSYSTLFRPNHLHSRYDNQYHHHSKHHIHRPDWFCWVDFILILSYLPSSAFQYLHRHVNMLSYFKAYFLKHLNSYKDFITGKWYLSNQEIHAFKIHYLKQRFSDEGITSVKNHIRRSLR